MELRVDVLHANADNGRHDSSTWLRVVAMERLQPQEDGAQTHHRRRVLCEKRLRDAIEHHDGHNWKQVCVKVAHAAAATDASAQRLPTSLLLELWEATAVDASDAFLTFVDGITIDLARWLEKPCMRWYPLRRTQTAGVSVVTDESAFEECNETLQPQEMHIQVQLKGMPSKHKAVPEPQADIQPTSRRHGTTGFQFVLPSELITRNCRFVSTRVGEILHEGNAGYLQELLPVTLYGKVPSCSLNVGGSKGIQQSALSKALQMLQLSCQYASYCAKMLDGNARALEGRHSKLEQRRAKLRAKRRQMEHQKSVLRRELQVAESSVDGLRMLLQEVDPECLARLEEQFPPEHGVPILTCPIGSQESQGDTRVDLQ